MTTTVKQQYVLSLIKKLNRPVFTTNELYETQGKKKQLSKKAITYHMISLKAQSKIIRVRRGSYILPETIPQQAISTKINPDVNKPKVASNELPSFLAHEDIGKLLDWKNESISDTNQKIENLKLKIIKLEKQKNILKTIKTTFC